MHLHTIPLSRTLKQIFMMAADSVMIVAALALSFTLLDKDFFALEQRFYFYLAIPVGSILMILYMLPRFPDVLAGKMVERDETVAERRGNQC